MSNFESKVKAHRAAKPMVWIKDSSGTTYICPKSEIKDSRKVTSEELTQCMDESLNPQNN